MSIFYKFAGDDFSHNVQEVKTEEASKSSFARQQQSDDSQLSENEESVLDSANKKTSGSDLFSSDN